MEVNDFMLLIGPQASGKSTIAKTVFFFKSLKDDLFRFILTELNQPYGFNKAVGSFAKIVRQKFLDYWGPTLHLNGFFIKYYYSKSVDLKLTLEPDNKFINPEFSPEFKKLFKNLINFAKKKWKQFPKQDSFLQTNSHTYLTNKDMIRIENEKGSFFRELGQKINEIFSEDLEPLFIPAGRSLVSTLTEQLQILDTGKLDCLTRVFVEKIMQVKSIFNVSIEDLIIQKKKLSQIPLNTSVLKEASNIIKGILKGSYICDKDGEKLYLDDNRYIKLNFSSSGQQESIWILHLLFLLLLEKQQSFVVIEEPEAHLFPVAQNYIAKLIALLVNQSNHVFITTHSPYMLTCFNNLLYASTLNDSKKVDKAKLSRVVKPIFGLKPSKVGIYYIEKDTGLPANIYDKEIDGIKVEMIDEASEQSNKTFDALLELDET
jgi:ABC-type phosphate transport system ATPase subunit